MKKIYQHPSCTIVRIQSHQLLADSTYKVANYESGGEENLGDVPPPSHAKANSNSVNWDDDWNK